MEKRSFLSVRKKVNSSMWSFNPKVKLSSSELFWNIQDCHSHLLPGVDDGFKSEFETLQALNTYEQFGIKTLYMTPHVMEDMPNKTIDLRTRFERIKSLYKGPIELRLGAEYMIDDVFRYRLEQKDLLPIGMEQNYLLMETSYYNSPIDFYDILERVRQQGYTPLLAHPERYMYLEYNDYQTLGQLGIQMQLNLLSLFGHYGETAQKKACWLLDHDLYCCAGSDFHNQSQIEFLLQRSLRKKTLKKIMNLPGLLCSVEKSEDGSNF